MILRAPFGVPGRAPQRAPRLPLVLRPIVLTGEEPVRGVDVVFGLVRGSFAVSGLVARRRRPLRVVGPAGAGAVRAELPCAS